MAFPSVPFASSPARSSDEKALPPGRYRFDRRRADPAEQSQILSNGLTSKLFSLALLHFFRKQERMSYWLAWTSECAEARERDCSTCVSLREFLRPLRSSDAPPASAGFEGLSNWNS